MSGLGRHVGATSGMVIFLLAVVASFPGIALGSSTGELTRVQVSADWAHGSLAGTAVRLDGCVQPPDEDSGEEPSIPPKQPQSPPWECGWIAYATAGPGSSSSDCASPTRRLSTLGPGVQLLWSSEELTAAGTTAFDLTDVGLVYGEAAPLLCLSAVEAVAEAVDCTDEVESNCPPYAIVHRHLQLASRLLRPEAQSLSEAALPAASSPNRQGRRPCRRVRLRRPHPARRHIARAAIAARGHAASKVRKGRCIRHRAIRADRALLREVVRPGWINPQAFFSDAVLLTAPARRLVRISRLLSLASP